MPGPASPAVVRASTILHQTVASYRDTKAEREADDAVLSYGRRGTTTAHALSAAIAELEGGTSCFLFPTGVAAIAGTLTALLRPGDHLLVIDTIFPATRAICEGLLARLSIDVNYLPHDATSLEGWTTERTVGLLLECPGSQTFDIADLPALCQDARARGLWTVADNTYGSGWLYRPLDLGCDASIIAGTKYLGGHADLMMGCVSLRAGSLRDRVRAYVHQTGQTLSPDDAFLTLRGLRTLALRLKRHAATGLALARWLSERPETATVLHPGLASHPGHGTWTRDAGGYNGLFSVRFVDGFRAESFADRLALFAVGSSWGGYESLVMPIEPYAARSHSGNSSRGDMLRLHAGLEHVDDLIADLEGAMTSVA